MKTLFLIILPVLLFSCSEKRQKAVEIPVESAAVAAPEILLGITKDGIFLRKEPSRKASKIINEKASEVLKETHYVSVDKSVKVRVLEKEKGWSKIQVVEPDWLQYSHIGWLESKYVATVEELHPKRKLPVKLKAFSDPEKLSGSLSKNGVGELSSWKYIEGLSWQSITNYYEVGDQTNDLGLKNNLAYYVTSPEESFVESIKLVLNINVPEEAEFAKIAFKDAIKKTFQSVDIVEPAALSKKIDRETKFVLENDKFIISLEPTKSKIMTLILEIKTK